MPPASLLRSATFPAGTYPFASDVPAVGVAVLSCQAPASSRQAMLLRPPPSADKRSYWRHHCLVVLKKVPVGLSVTSAAATLLSAVSSVRCSSTASRR